VPQSGAQRHFRKRSCSASQGRHCAAAGRRQQRRTAHAPWLFAVRSDGNLQGRPNAGPLNEPVMLQTLQSLYTLLAPDAAIDKEQHQLHKYFCILQALEQVCLELLIALESQTHPELVPKAGIKKVFEQSTGTKRKRAPEPTVTTATANAFLCARCGRTAPLDQAWELLLDKKCLTEGSAFAQIRAWPADRSLAPLVGPRQSSGLHTAIKTQVCQHIWISAARIARRGPTPSPKSRRGAAAYNSNLETRILGTAADRRSANI
jgi:hypothetical protein